MTNDATPTISNKRGSRGLLILSECWPRGFPAIGPRLACNSLETTASECWIDPWETFGISEPVYQCPDSDCVVNASIPRNLSWGTHLAKWTVLRGDAVVAECTFAITVRSPLLQLSAVAERSVVELDWGQRFANVSAVVPRPSVECHHAHIVCCFEGWSTVGVEP